MKNRVEIAMLFDFYGQLMTEKQSEIFSLYYEDDLSLAEIATEQSISRQGVHDVLKRGEKLLYKYEEKLRLVEKFATVQNQVQEILEIVEKIQESSSVQEIQPQIQKIKYISNMVLENS